jgi:CDP-4-dehydro-6-deoxyglucose reductase, E1
MNNSWRSNIAAEWAARQATDRDKSHALFPLAMNPFGEEEIIAMTEVLLTGNLTLGQEVEKAEKKFAIMVGAPYAVMVNSGSSANLLAVSAMANKLRLNHCSPGDHVLIPAVCWSTSVFPLLQNNLIPIFVDVCPRTFNITVDLLEKKLTSRVKAVMAVHVLGNAIDMRELMIFVARNKLILIEDTCESLGSFCRNDTASASQMLGTFGDFGTFSFYFSHHITSGEGGMIICKTEEDFNLLRCLRAHGWTRHLTNRQKVEENYPDFDSRFLFVNVGYNLRPLEVQGAMISVQLGKLSEFNACRRDNMKRIRDAFLSNERICHLLSLMEASPGVDPAWFGVAALLHQPYSHHRFEFLKYLEENGVENRPIIGGNFIRQPCITAFCENQRPESYPGAEAIHRRGFFIGVHQIKIDQAVIDKLVEIILAFSFNPKHVVLVTGSDDTAKRCIQDGLEKEGYSGILQ